MGPRRALALKTAFQVFGAKIHQPYEIIHRHFLRKFYSEFIGDPNARRSKSRRRRQVGGVMNSGANVRSTRMRLGVPCADAIELQEQLDRLKSRLRVAVIFGGDKSKPGGVVYPSHNARSWKSYESVANDIAASLRRNGFRHVQTMPEDMCLGDRLRGEGIHLAWLNSAGVQGYNSVAHAPATLEMLGVPYVGHDPLSATTLDNKHAFKREAVCAGLPTAPFCTWHGGRGRFQPDRNSRFRNAFGDYCGPFVVKPVSGRASLHVHVVQDKMALPDVAAGVYQATENVVLIEKYLPGREYCIAVAGPIIARGGRLRRGRDPFTFALLERLLAAEEKIFTSMDVRPITNDRFKIVDHREGDLIERMRRLACEVFLEFNLGSLIRMDMRADESGQLYILEANPKPDLKQPAHGVTSLIAAGLPEAGMSYDDLILSLLADRFDYLQTHHRGAVQHILDLTAAGANVTSVRRLRRRPASGGDGAAHSASNGNVTTLMQQLAVSARDIDALASAALHSVAHKPAAAQPTVANSDAQLQSAEKIDAAVALLNQVAAEINVKALKSVAAGRVRRDGKARIEVA
jgi:D-alanine-D-alanine ligase